MARVGVVAAALVMAVAGLGLAPERAAGKTPSPGSGSDGDAATTERVLGDDPVTVAVGVSQARFLDDAAEYAVLSRVDDFPDSLAGAPLTRRGPMLFAEPGGIPVASLDELGRALPDGGTVYLLGGDQALRPVIEQQLGDSGYDVVRLAGDDRLTTAVAIADEVRRLFPGSTDVVLARASGTPENPSAGWADSITGGAFAAHFAAPILITPTDELAPVTAEAIARYAPARTVLLGGEVALSADVAAGVPNPQRFGGATRFDTAADIAARLWPGGGTGPFVVSNGTRPDGWALGLPAAGLSSDASPRLLLADTDDATGPTITAATIPCGTGPQVEVLLVGGESILTARVQQQLDAVDGPPCPPDQPACDPSYPDLCLPPPPPDLDCDSPEVGGRTGFPVVGDDPHDLDRDNDGVGCEDDAPPRPPAPEPLPPPPPAPEPPPPPAQNCDSAYPDFCIPPPPPDLNCGDFAQKDFTAMPPDPHGLDGNGDGVACES